VNWTQLVKFLVGERVRREEADKFVMLLDHPKIEAIQIGSYPSWKITKSPAEYQVEKIP
jgi:hypothetical protein